MTNPLTRPRLAPAAACLALLAAGAPAWAQQVIAYPERGQTPEQQARDTAECQAWAAQQVGGSPSAAVPPPPVAQAPQGSAVRGGARGAAVGAVGGAIGGDAGKGAAAGAAAGALVGGMRSRDQHRQAEAQQQAYANQQAAVAAQQQDVTSRAVAACLTGRGYSVR
jgi:hypothetical protein